LGIVTAVQTPPAPGAPAETHVRDRADITRQIRLVVTFAIASAFLLYFALAVNDPSVQFILGERVTKDVQPQDLDGAIISWLAVAVAVVALGLAALNRYPRGAWALMASLVVGLMFYLGFLMWAYADQGEGFVASIANPIPGTIRIATPLVFGALAGVMCERSGVINIAIEAQFLAGLLIASMLAVFALRYQVNQVVLGVVLVAFASGLTSFLLGQIPSDPAIKQYFNEPPILSPIRIPGLADIPLVGEALFDQTVLVYLMYISVVLVTLLLFQTKWGLRVRSVGEHPMAADTVGIKVNRIRWQAVLVGGVFAGLGGAYYTVGSTGAFDRDVSAGTGFIALAAVIMGRWHPIGATFAALFFGFMWNLQNQLSFADKLPGELLGAAPYLATIIAVAGFVGRVRPPAADGEPYVKS
jgi:simple sugar transport system permease protein